MTASADTPRAPPRRARGCRGCAIATLIGLVVLGALGLAGLAFVPDWLVASRLADELDARGVACDPLDADVSLLLDRVVVAPTRCTIRDGSVESVELLDDVEIDLESFEPAAARAGRIVVTLRADLAGAQPAGSAPVLRALGVTDRVVGLTHASAALADASLPAITATEVQVVRADRPIATLHELSITGRRPTAIQIARAELPTSRGDVTLRNLAVTASRETVRLAGDVEVDADLPLLGRTRREGALVVEATGLDTAQPDWSVQGSL